MGPVRRSRLPREPHDRRAGAARRGLGELPAHGHQHEPYFPNDPRATEQNLVYETANEAIGACADGIYRPQCDTDFDGVLDRPNTLGVAAQVEGVDNLLDWYERQTDTLVLQPMLPMNEKTEYAVVLTDRLVAPDGRRSALPSRESATRRRPPRRKLAGILGDPSRTGYYGDIAGTGLSHVAFAWTFTTQPVQEDLLLLRDGLYGKGPFASFATDFPTSSLKAFPTVGTTRRPPTNPRAGRARRPARAR